MARGLARGGGMVTGQIDTCITLQYCFSSEKENGDTQAKKSVIILIVKAIFIWACCVKRMRKAKNEQNFGRIAQLYHIKADSRVAVYGYEYDVRSMVLSS